MKFDIGVFQMSVAKIKLWLKSDGDDDYDYDDDDDDDDNKKQKPAILGTTHILRKVLT